MSAGAGGPVSKRADKILEILTRQGRAEVSALSQALGVSQVTIRKDLDELEGRGILTREYGCAVLKSFDEIPLRMAYHYEAKRKIAGRAAALVQDGDTILMESGSCCALLAEALGKEKRDLTIITNSAFIAGFIRGFPGVQAVLLGGLYQRGSQVMVGPLVGQCVKNFCVDLFFLGADGYTPQAGFTNRDQLRAQAVRDMAAQAERAVVLTESEKFSKRGVVPLGLGGKLHAVITDGGILQKDRQALLQSGAQVLTV